MKLAKTNCGCQPCPVPGLRGVVARSAFTLIEILVAVAILGLILTAIYASWTAILRGADTGNRAAAIAQRERISRRVIEDALASVQYFTENASHYAFIADTTDDRFATLSLVARLPSSFPGSGMFPGQPLRRVTFAVKPGEKGGNQLLMSQSWLLTPTNIVEDPYTIKLADNINLFSLEFWDTNINDWAAEWLPTNQLPQVVRVAMAFGVPGQNANAADMVSTVVSLPAIAVTRDMQMPDGQTRVGPGGRPPPGSKPGNILNPGNNNGQPNPFTPPSTIVPGRLKP